MTRLVGEEQREAEMFINNATIYADDARESLVYDLTLQAGQMPDAQMSSVSLFVDSGGDPAASSVQVCSATSVCKTVSSLEDFNEVTDALGRDGNWSILAPPLSLGAAVGPYGSRRLLLGEYQWLICSATGP